jgi:lipopolysaccharide transport system permease protein
VYGITPTIGLLAIPFFVVVACAAAVGIGSFFAALNVRYRDVRYVIPLMVQLWLFLTPVAYPATLVPGTWRWVYALNPMVGVVEGFRWAFLGMDASGRDIGISVASAAAMLLIGLFVFRRMEDTFADEI